MRIIIIGAGESGSHLAAKLCELKHDVVIIDSDADALKAVKDELDIMAVEGEGTSPRVLEEAEVEKADLLVAVTDRDEVNILACVLARAAGVPNKVARVSNSDYTQPSEMFNLRSMGVDLVVSQDKECALALFNNLRMPGTSEAVDLMDGRILAVGMKVDTESLLLRTQLKAFPEPDLLKEIRFLAISRGSEVLIPHGDTRFMIGDDVFLSGEPGAISNFLRCAWPDLKPFEKIIIAGGSNLGLHLARLLEKTSMRVVLLEKDGARAEFCSGELSRGLVLKGDAMDKDALESAGSLDGAAFAAVMDGDEDNIIACLIAEKLGARFTLAKINRPEYIPIINSLSLLDRIVNPPLSMISAILHFVRGKYVNAASLFHKLPGELLEVRLKPRHKWVGTAIKNLGLSAGLFIAAVRRGDDIVPATGDLVLAENDMIVIFALSEAVHKIETLFRR